MNLRTLTILLLLFLLSGLSVFAQTDSDSVSRPFEAEISLIGKSHGDNVVLRWAPSTPGAWSYLNKVGYVIERTTFSSEADFDPSSYQRLSDSPILPLALEEWEAVVNDGGDQALSAIAAQALYGEGFNTEGAKIFDIADEYINRYSFSLLAADLSSITAEALGLRFVDRSVQKDQHYIYRVFPSLPSANYKIDTAYLVIQNVISPPIQAPVISEAYGSELQVRLSWDKIMHESLFSAYIVERSDNEGASFEALHEIPFINPESDNINGQLNVFQYTDSVPRNYDPYSYRLIGLTPFGEKSPPSEVVVEMGRDRTPPPSPLNVNARQIGPGNVEITWEMPNPPPDLDAFYIGRGDDLDKNFQPIHEEEIPKDSTSFIDYNSDRMSGNYYVVAAVDTAGNGSISMVSYASVLDSIPPSAPLGLIGEIDSTGLVTLQWELGSEEDLAGYMVYFTNSADHVYSTVNSAPYADTIYTDTIQIKTLTKKIYYKIKAVDTRWNYSDYSEVLELTRPDIIPPTSPVFTSYKIVDEGVRLEWIPSSSNDVIGYELEIYTNGELKRKVSVEKRDSLSLYTYVDKKLEPGNVYTYVAITIDESGLRSEPSASLSVKSVDYKPKEAIEDLSASINEAERFVQLNWSYADDGKVSRYLLFRAVDGNSFVTYKSLPVGDNSFKDNMIRDGIKYEYTIKAVYKTGKQTPFSNIVSAGLF